MKQKRAAVLRELDGYIEKWRGILHLEDWRIKKFIVRKEHVDGPEITAQVTTDSPYMLCSLEVFPSIFERTRSEREHMVVHELCHCIVNRLDELMRRLQGGHIVTDKERIDALENVNQKLTGILIGLVGDRRR